MVFGVGIRCGEVDPPFRAAETAVVAAIEQFTLRVREIEERQRVRLHIVQRRNVRIDIGDFPPFDRHPVAQNPFHPHPVAGRLLAHDQQQVIGHRVAVGRTARELTEEQDVFRIETIVGQAARNLRRFTGIVKLPAGNGWSGLRLRWHKGDGLPRRDGRCDGRSGRCNQRGARCVRRCRSRMCLRFCKSRPGRYRGAWMELVGGLPGWKFRG